MESIRELADACQVPFQNHFCKCTAIHCNAMFDSWRSGITLCRRHTTMWSGETNWCHFILGCLGFASVFAMQVQEAWMANHTEIAGVAADFRGPRKVEPLWAVFLWDVLNFIKTLLNMFCFFLWTLSVSNKHWQVKWVEGVFEKESKSSDFPTIILDTSHLQKSLEWLAFLLSFWILLILEVMTEGLEQDFFGLALLPQRGSLSVQLFLVPISKLFELLRLTFHEPLGRSCLQFGVWSAKAGFAGLTFKGSEFWRFIIVYFWVWLTSGRW